MQKTKIFNPQGDDTNRQIVGGDTTGIYNLNAVKYNWANNIYRAMMNCFWIPEKIDLSDDKLSDLTDDEKQGYYEILSFLTFLDSAQTNNLPNINSYITAPEVKLCLSVHQFFEAVHSQSYGYIIETVIPLQDRNTVYDYWRLDPVLFKRNQYIGLVYQKFLDHDTFDNFKEVLIANYLLEGIYFYAGFLFFYNLAMRKKMLGTAAIIKLINRDELIHCSLFEKIINEVMDIHRQENMELIYSMMETAVSHEINWCQHIIGDKILGLTVSGLEEYIKYISNRRLKYLGLQPIYTNPTPVNNFVHLEKIADLLGDANVKSNYFESTVTSYNMATGLTGWNDI